MLKSLRFPVGLNSIALVVPKPRRAAHAARVAETRRHEPRHHAIGEHPRGPESREGRGVRVDEQGRPGRFQDYLRLVNGPGADER